MLSSTLYRFLESRTRTNKKRAQTPERDYARKVIRKGFSGRTYVSEMMTGIVAQITPENSLEKCMELMTHKRVRHLPVLNENQLIGIISIGDVIKALISEQGFIINQLESYISSTVLLK